ncbi:Tripartite tricarboxylate transporter family receptor [Enhydrobacter aerosaccus]|uniref:Tripartite tricarboxylate transporter family receptor n=1 Tax=Enhydrobacter aerosaccus TaxID=225324 RepID=A0A1T4SAD7_9HYPH|nr:tripartite tricarboxylate transporter substrate-binding protein [Enhydrobacter aerosaccus]SKA25165.1 Tripartite tricarboxylate transporter family receptor [Enhydrobacter aerosaccus]
MNRPVARSPYLRLRDSLVTTRGNRRTDRAERFNEQLLIAYRVRREVRLGRGRPNHRHRLVPGKPEARHVRLARGGNTAALPWIGSGAGGGVELVHLPYKGGAAAIQDLLLAGQLPAAVFTLAAVLGPIRSRSLRVLATTAPKRSSLLADVQTVREAGYPALEGLIWFGILVPARTPTDIVARLNTMVCQVLQTDAIKAGLARQSLEVAGSTTSEFAELLTSDTRRWGELVKKSEFTRVE